MKAKLVWMFYLLGVGTLVLVTYFALQYDNQLDIKKPIAVFVLQLMVVLATARSCGYLLRKAGQPTVVGEIIAGVILGPSLLPQIAPGFSAFLFPDASIGYLQVFSQVGLIFFMFILGVEVDLGMLYKKAASALVISPASIIVPFALGIPLSYFLYGHFAPANVPFHVFAMFLGTALSITAFPVLGRIIQERGMAGTRIGNLAIACAAIDDITAWCLLALLIAMAKGGSSHTALYMILMILMYVLVMFGLIRPILKFLLLKATSGKTVDNSRLVLPFVVLLLSAWCGEIIGVHVLFGAFLAGIIMPRDVDFRKSLREGIGNLLFIVLLPLFFVCTGLRTHIGALNSSFHVLTCALIITVAVVGKLGGSAIAARLMGESIKDSLSIGVLMNTRGLVELVVLNIGLDLGVLSSQLFTMMVIMALVTTIMATPLLILIDRVYK